MHWLNLATPVNACGPVYTMPIFFVFGDVPDLPFVEFTEGKIGIVRADVWTQDSRDRLSAL